MSGCQQNAERASSTAPVDAPLITDELREGDLVPDFSLQDLQAKSYRLYEFLEAGNYVLVNFWATWCPPCLEELPSMEDLNQQWKGRLFSMLAISVDDEAQIVRDFLGQLGARQPTFLILHDPGKLQAGIFGTEKFPETYLIGPDKRLLKKFVGPRNWTSSETLLELEEAIGLKTQ